MPSPVTNPSPLRVEMEDAVDAIRKFAAGRCSARTVVGITGPVGAGKSHLAAALARCVISTDSYLPDYEHIPEAQRDLPELAHYHALGEDLRHLKQGTAREIPVWSFQTHRRESVQLISPESLIVCEGIQAFYPPVRASLDVCVFVEAPADVRWSRWEHLEITGVRGWGVEVAHRFFHTVADPTFERFAPEYRALADVVVTNDRYKPRRQ